MVAQGPRTFEVGDIADAALVAAWERHNAETLIELACRIPAGRFRGREVTQRVDRVRLALVRADPHAVGRDRRMAAERPADAIAAYVAVRGDTLLEYDGRQRIVRPGQLLLCDLDRPFLRGFRHGLEELAVRVPRDALTELTGLRSLVAPLVVDTAGDRADGHGRALARLVGRAVAADVRVPTDERTVLELVSVLAAGSQVSLPLAHRAAARAYVDDHLTRSDLSAADIAAGIGISERHLSRIFAEAGTSVPHHVLGRRLDLARALLAAGTGERTVDVARRCGFASASYFSRSFRRRFGVAAGDVRSRPRS